MIVNFSFLNSKNGMYYYAQDYVGLLNHSDVINVGELNVRTSPYKKILNIIYIYYLAWCRGEFVYTPTIHPLPWINNQLVICHDSYPFKGPKGRLKKLLLMLSLMSSKCNVAYINKSDSRCFVDSLNLSDSRKIFFPNLIKPIEPDIGQFEVNVELDIVNIALVGTDSDKKRYEFLFDTILNRHEELKDKFKFHIYGGYNSYCELIFQKYSAKLNLIWCDPQKSSLFDLLKSANVVISVARNEGFGRPIAFSLQLGLPTMLIDDQTFVEFFSNAAYIFKNEASLIDSIIDIVCNHKYKPYPTQSFILEQNEAISKFVVLVNYNNY